MDTEPHKIINYIQGVPCDCGIDYVDIQLDNCGATNTRFSANVIAVPAPNQKFVADRNCPPAELQFIIRWNS